MKKNVSGFRMLRFTLTHLVVLLFSWPVGAQTPPPAPTLVGPANGAALVQPITLEWNPIIDPDGPMGSYTWQVGTSSTFGTVIAEGSQNLSSEEIPLPTRDQVSGLPNGTYFWRVMWRQMVGGTVGALASPWSQVRSFNVTGLGPAPGTPSITAPANPASFHPFEFFDITWTAVPGAQYYLLEADDGPSFSHPLTLTTEPMQFGTRFHIGWGNELNIFYRVRAVSADNVRGLPSPTLNVHIANTAPVPPAPTPLSPVGGASITMPFIFDWTDIANPQIPGYDLDIDDEPNFQGAVGVLLVPGVSRSDYMVVEDPLVEGRNIFPPGTYFWRVRALHGNVVGPWSATATFTVVASPATPPGVELFWLINEPGSVSGGNPTQSRVTLNQPAGPGGALIKIASDMPHAETPSSVLIPEGKTDGWVSPVTTVPVGGATIGNTRAAYAGEWQQSSLGLWQILHSLSLSDEVVIGGDTVVGTVTLLSPAPPGGVEVTIVSRDTSLAAPPEKILIPAGGLGATFNIATAPVSVPTRVVIDCGTAFEGYRAPENWLNLMPAGSPAPAPSLASVSLDSSSIVGGGGTTTGTLMLTGPAPAGGAEIWVNGSMEGEVVTPGNVTVPAGSINASFTITGPQVNTRHYVLIQARYGTFGGSHAKLLEIQPPPAGTPTVLALAVRPRAVIGGDSTRGMVGLVMPAPAGGGVVSLSTSDPSLAQVPPSVSIAAGNSANSFDITTSRVFLQSSVRIDATAGGVTKSFWMDLGSDPNAPPLLQSVTVSPTSVAGGGTVTGTVFLSQPAPTGGITVTLATSSSVATAPGIVNVPGGQTSANFTVTTSPVSSSTQVIVTAFYDTTRSATLTVTSGSPPSTPGTPSLLGPANGATVVQPINLDWSDASNAASYEIQVDDSSNFSTPLVRSLTSTASQTTVTGLSTVRHWWRVRARNSAGVAGNWSASRRFTPQAAPAAATLSSLSLSPTSLVGGNTSQGTVTLSSAAPSGGAVVTLSSSSPSVAPTPASVTITAGATSVTFIINTATVTTMNNATISATFSGTARTATLTVNPVPPPPPPASLSSLTLSPTSVTGGNTSQGTVTLSSAAPNGGALVTLSSSNPNAATVPASATVTAGATTANFAVSTLNVTASTAVTISGSYNTVTRTVTLTVNPTPTGPLPAPLFVSPAKDARFAPGTNIAFDWSDVSGAASYTIQIDDHDDFPSPWLVNQNVATSTLSTSTLPTRTMWWRVRANDASGNPGNWPSGRRFEVKN
ncbi:MAG: hypothetical protein L0Z50_08220 [Verrucomicrobiales bacterium]|nr:hypothetical protein [Verrucomicrobiales bacterium]